MQCKDEDGDYYVEEAIRMYAYESMMTITMLLMGIGLSVGQCNVP